MKPSKEKLDRRRLHYDFVGELEKQLGDKESHPDTRATGWWALALFLHLDGLVKPRRSFCPPTAQYCLTNK